MPIYSQMSTYAVQSIGLLGLLLKAIRKHHAKGGTTGFMDNTRQTKGKALFKRKEENVRC